MPAIFLAANVPVFEVVDDQPTPVPMLVSAHQTAALFGWTAAALVGALQKLKRAFNPLLADSTLLRDGQRMLVYIAMLIAVGEEIGED